MLMSVNTLASMRTGQTVEQSRSRREQKKSLDANARRDHPGDLPLTMRKRKQTKNNTMRLYQKQAYFIEPWGFRV